MLEDFIKKIKKLPFIDDVEKSERDDNCIHIRIYDENLTEDEYENGMYFTRKFTDQMKKTLTDLWKMCAGDGAKFTKLEIEHMDKDWFSVKVKIKL